MGTALVVIYLSFKYLASGTSQQYSVITKTLLVFASHHRLTPY